ncbi:MAG: helix-turn-helix transcriptional regulator [Flavobacteriaceae bacterium]|nr:helix-turn-helix transcriptional regulator [Flavobacteriaceae bacterium]
MDLNNRIQKIIDYSMLTSSEFADEIGVQRSSISHITSGRNKPSLDFIKKIKERFPELQWEWIIEGKGNMLPSSPTPPKNLEESKINPNEEGANLFNFDNLAEEEKKEEDIPFSIARELNIPAHHIETGEISDSQPLENEEIQPILNVSDNQNNKIKKIIFFYENGKFEIFEP